MSLPPNEPNPTKPDPESNPEPEEHATPPGSESESAPGPQPETSAGAPPESPLPASSADEPASEVPPEGEPDSYSETTQPIEVPGAENAYEPAQESELPPPDERAVLPPDERAVLPPDFTPLPPHEQAGFSPEDAAVLPPEDQAEPPSSEPAVPPAFGTAMIPPYDAAAPGNTPVGIPPTEPPPSQEEPPRIPRRRRGRRRLVPRELERRAAFFRELVHQSTPSFDFFLFCIVAGVAAGAALLLDSPALFVLAALLSPFMAPVLGLSLSTAIGSLGFFFRSLIALLIGSVLVFGLGIAAGWLSQYYPGLAFTQAAFHTTFTWPDLVVVLLGAGLTAYLAVRAPKARPLASSVALAYELFLPLAAAGFGWALSIPSLYPTGLILFANNLVLAAVTATFMLVFLGVRPISSGAATAVSVLLLLVLVGAALFGVGNAVMANTGFDPLALVAEPTATPTATPTLTATATPLPTQTAQPSPTITITLTNTLVPTNTATITITPSPTPVYGLVDAGNLNGVIIRPEPGSLEIVTTLLNGNLVEILPEVVNKNGFLWIHVRAPNGQEGWVQDGLVVTATPRP